jgi:hypothetical protein
MGGGALILLKSGQIGPKTAKQAEIRLANLLKILGNASPKPQRTCDGCISSDFRWIWLIVQNHQLCYLDHSFCWGIGAVSC